MTWQIAITIQVFVSSFMTLFTRRLTLSTQRVFFGIGVASYCVVAVMGTVYSLAFLHGHIDLPTAQAWRYILLEGICIPAAWLIQYKTISYVGAGNAMIINTLSTVSAALMGIIFLHESVSPTFTLGAVFILASTLAAIGIQADTRHHASGSFALKLLLVLAGALLFGVGMYAEKQAITASSVWSYAMFGWAMQAVGALALFTLFGRKEMLHITRGILKKGATLGLITSVAGGLYIYALSKGNLSHTTVAASGKLAITVLLAALFLHERNAIALRVAAFLLSVAGLWLVVG